MRQLMLAAGVACAVVAFGELADAQVNTMPGQVTGTGYGLGSVGQATSKAAPQAGTPINLPANSKMVRKYDPNNPYDALNGTSYTKDQVLAPVAPMNPAIETSFLSKMKIILGLEQPQGPPVPRSTYFPSLTRRNRERAEARQFRRD